MSVAGQQNKASEGGVLEIVKIIVHAVIIALVVRTLLFQPFNIPSGSLIPTLEVGDYVFVSKYSYGYSKYSIPLSPPLFSGRIWSAPPQRGDIAVFKVPKDNSTDYIKRVIGLPGDRIQVTDGILRINGEAVKREPAGTRVVIDGFGVQREAPVYWETLPNGVRHQVLEENGDRGNLDNTEEFVVRADHYFMMGDNRDNSEDSRVWGDVPFENFVGKAQLIFFSVKDGDSALAFWKWPWSVRVGR